MKRESKVNKERLKTAIRCYFRIDRKKKPILNDYFTKYYLFEMAICRHFIERHEADPDFKIFLHWLGNGEPITPTTTETANHHTTTAPKVQTINAKFINLLIDEILKDLETELINIKPYFETKAEQRKRETENLHFFGLKRPSPLRLPNEIKMKFNELGLTTPPPPKMRATKSRAARLFQWLEDCKFEVEKYYFTLKNKDLTQRAQIAKELIEAIEKKMIFTNLIENE